MIYYVSEGGTFVKLKNNNSFKIYERCNIEKHYYSKQGQRQHEIGIYEKN